MTSATRLASTGDLESFAAVYDGTATGELLFEALTNPDEEARFAIAGRLLDDGADAAHTQDGQNAVTMLLGAHKRLGRHDAELVASLIRAGADVNFRERRGKLVAQLVATSRVDSDEDRRPMYAALFGSPDFDLEQPTNVSNPVTSVRTFLTKAVANKPEKFEVLGRFLAED